MCFSLVHIQQEAMNVCVAQRSRRNISFLTWRSRTTTMTMRMKMRKMKRNLHHMKTCCPLVHQTPTRQQEVTPVKVSAHNRAPLILSPAPAVIRSPPHGGSGTAGERHRQVAGERCSPGGAGRYHQEPSPPAVRAAPQAAASLPVWSCPHQSTACLPEPSCLLPPDTSHPLPREDHLPSDLFRLSNPFRPAATDRLNFEPLRHCWGCSTDPLGAFLGRVLEQKEVTSKRSVYFISITHTYICNDATEKQ